MPSSHKQAKRKRVRLREASGQDFVMYERTYAPGFHDLIFGMLRDAGIIPNVRQTAGEMPTLISLVDSGMGVAILPASVAKRSVASVVACEIMDEIPMSEIGIAVREGNRAPVLDNFRSFALEKSRRARGALFANQRWIGLLPKLVPESKERPGQHGKGHQEALRTWNGRGRRGLQEGH